jgi:hypothetical protein
MQIGFAALPAPDRAGRAAIMVGWDRGRDHGAGATGAADAGHPARASRRLHDARRPRPVAHGGDARTGALSWGLVAVIALGCLAQRQWGMLAPAALLAILPTLRARAGRSDAVTRMMVAVTLPLYPALLLAQWGARRGKSTSTCWSSLCWRRSRCSATGARWSPRRW